MDHLATNFNHSLTKVKIQLNSDQQAIIIKKIQENLEYLDYCVLTIQKETATIISQIYSLYSNSINRIQEQKALFARLLSQTYSYLSEEQFIESENILKTEYVKNIDENINDITQIYKFYAQDFIKRKTIGEKYAYFQIDGLILSGHTMLIECIAISNDKI